MKNSCSNLTQLDINIRWLLSILFIVLSITTPYWYLSIISIDLIYSSIKRECGIYSFLGINNDLKEKNKFIQALPKYNPEPVLIINNKAEVIFKNNPAKDIFPDIDVFAFLGDEKFLKELIKKNETEQIEYKFDSDKIYIFTLKGAKEINSVMVYGTDITEIVKANEEVLNIQKEIVYTMGAIGETRSKETGNHVKRVAEYSKILALKVGLSEEEANLLKMASPMHDIGKVGIKDEILNKPGKLTFDEFEIMKSHAELGYDLLKNSDKPILKAAATVAYEHHEKWDGSGYPRKKKGEDIHIYGRITAIADVFDALGSTRVYKKAWPLEKIFDLLEREKGKHFDPQLIELFFEHFDEFNKIRLKYVD